MEDIVRFAPIAYRLGSKKGYLRDKAAIDSSCRQYCVLYGNLLYCYRCEDPATYKSTIFLEYSTVKILNNPTDVFGFSIATVGGSQVNFYGTGYSEVAEWLEAIESNKYISMIRKFEDNETSTLSYKYRVDEQDRKLNEVEHNYEDLLTTQKETLKQLDEKMIKIKNLELEIFELKSRVSSINSERLLLLQSRGVTPKQLPRWATTSGNESGSIDTAKIWIGSWNVSGVDPFNGSKSFTAKNMSAFVPPGYDIYAIGVQDCISDSIFVNMEELLSSKGYYRLSLAFEDSSTGNTVDLSKLIRRSDSSMRSPKFTGICIFIHHKLRSEVKAVSSTQYAVQAGSNKGVVAVAITLFNRTIAFVAAHFELYSKQESRRQIYQQLVTTLGEKLGEGSFHLNEQFNHIFWFGDLSSQSVDLKGEYIPAENVIQMLESNQQRYLFENNDQVRQDRKNYILLYGYREPNPFPNFYPTYKKLEHRPIHDYSNKSWVRECYKYKDKQSFMRGGGTKEKTPSYSDRILYHSMVDLGEDLLPECQSQTLLVHLQDDSSKNGNTSSKLTDGNRYNIGSIDSDKQISPANSSEPKLSKPIEVTIDNYQSVNDGEIFSISDHSPVFATFILRLRKDYEPFKVELIERLGEDKGDIKELLSALASSPSHSPGIIKESTKYASDYDSSKNPFSEPSTPSKEPVDSSVLKSLASSRFDFSSSLLPPGQHKIILKNIRLIWGGSEDIPSNVKILFPSPFETEAGEKFVDFYSETKVQEEGPFHGSFNGAASNADPYVARASTTKLTSSAKMSNKGHRMSLGSMDGAMLGLNDDSKWRKCGPSRTGTSCILDCDVSRSGHIPDLQLVWRGNEALDKLHISMQVKMAAVSFNGSGKREDDGRGDTMTGHCSLSLEQLCKAALVATGGKSGSISLTRLLLKDGLPMYSIDSKMMQREQVTMCCVLELAE